MDPIADRARAIVADFVMMLMPPPDEHVGSSQDFGRQPLRRFVERGGAHVLDARRAQRLRDRRMNARGIDRRHSRVGALVPEFVPDGHTHRGAQPNERI